MGGGGGGGGGMGRERLCPFMHMAWVGIPHGIFFIFGVAHLILDLSVVLMQCIQSNLTQSQRMDTVILSEAGNKTQPAKSGCCSRK